MHWICLSYFLQLRAKKQHWAQLPTKGHATQETYLETRGMKKCIDGFVSTLREDNIQSLNSTHEVIMNSEQSVKGFPFTAYLMQLYL